MFIFPNNISLRKDLLILIGVIIAAAQLMASITLNATPSEPIATLNVQKKAGMTFKNTTIGNGNSFSIDIGD